MASWQNGNVTKFEVDKIWSWQNGKSAKWQVGKMASRQNGISPEKIMLFCSPLIEMLIVVFSCIISVLAGVQNVSAQRWQDCIEDIK